MDGFEDRAGSCARSILHFAEFELSWDAPMADLDAAVVTPREAMVSDDVEQIQEPSASVVVGSHPIKGRVGDGKADSNVTR